MATTFDPSRLDWNLLRAFVGVMEHGSLTAAARACGLSQPTLSRQLAALEAASGGPLFERTARRLTPTAHAQALAEPARRMLAAAQAMSVAAADHAQGLAGTVRITASEIVSVHVLPPILATLAQSHPEIEIELVASDQLGNLLEREADIAVRMVRPTQNALITRHLADWPLGLFAHPDYLARHPQPVTLDTAHQHRWVGFDQEQSFLEGLRAVGMDIDRHFFASRTDHKLAALAMTRAGLGIGVVAVPLAKQLGELVQVFPDQVLPVLPVWLTAHREMRSSARMRAVFDALAEGLTRWTLK